jgi:hypothetical protein
MLLHTSGLELLLCICRAPPSWGRASFNLLHAHPALSLHAAACCSRSVCRLWRTPGMTLEGRPGQSPGRRLSWQATLLRWVAQHLPWVRNKCKEWLFLIMQIMHSILISALYVQQRCKLGCIVRLTCLDLPDGLS